MKLHLAPVHLRGFLTRVTPEQLLTVFDVQIRRRPSVDEPGSRVEVGDRVVRAVAALDGWNGVTWSDLGAANADAVIADQISRFRQLGRGWEWKHYSYDQPADLPARLTAAGLVAGAPETVLVAELDLLDLDTGVPAGVELVQVTDAAGAAAMVQVHDQVFGGDHARIGRAVLAGLAQDPPTVAAVLAMADGVPVSSGRLEFAYGTDFASIWGGGTVPTWRRQGIFRALVAFRARLAAEAGFRYLQVDATPDSRPILRRFGFIELATTTPFTHQ